VYHFVLFEYDCRFGQFNATACLKCHTPSAQCEYLNIRRSIFLIDDVAPPLSTAAKTNAQKKHKKAVTGKCHVLLFRVNAGLDIAFLLIWCTTKYEYGRLVFWFLKKTVFECRFLLLRGHVVFALGSSAFVMFYVNEI